MKQSFFAGCVSFLLALGCPAVRGIEIQSPDGHLVVNVYPNANQRLHYTILRDGKPVIEESKIDLMINTYRLGRGVVLSEPERISVDETYASRGAHSVARNRYNGIRVPVRHPAEEFCPVDIDYILETRVFNDGFAWRMIVTNDQPRQIFRDDSEWVVPAGSSVWYHGQTDCYEGVHQSELIETIKADTILAVPATIILPDGLGYAAITESQLVHFSGMTLMAKGKRSLRIVYEDDPTGWIVDGTITTPWRVTMVSPDLNRLVNCDIVNNLCPAPAADLAFANWIRPGRCVWSWFSEDTGDWTLQKQYVDYAAELGFEFSLIDFKWEQWKDGDKDKWNLLQEVVDYGKSKQVDIWVWKDWHDLIDPDQRLDFFQQLKQIGVVGVKIDYMSSEAVERIGFYTDVLHETGKIGLMIDFHGANKNTGESRTWPHEMTREAVLGMEYNGKRTFAITPAHNTTLPFTRYLAGAADYTPCTFDPQRIKGTTFSHQLACAIVFTSPFLCLADNPKRYLESLAKEILKQIPATWDETVVLPESKIGELAAFARRKGDTWFVGILNGTDAKSYSLSLAFLPENKDYHATLSQDAPDRPDAMKVSSQTVKQSDTLTIDLQKGGGFVAVLKP